MSSSRRFALVTPNYFPRTCGVGDYSMRLGRELVKRGHAVEIFTREPAEPNPEAPEIVAVGARGATPTLLAERLRHQIKAFGPTDLVLQYTPQMLGASRFGSPATLWLAVAARRAGMRVTLIAHELFLPWRRRPDLAVGAAAMRAQTGLLMKAVDRTVVTMQMRVDELRPLTRALRIPEPAVIPVGSNALPLPPVPNPGGRLRLGLFSTLASTKRFDVALDCFAVVHARHPQAELIVLGDLGDPTDPRVAALREAVARHPAVARIRLPGRLELADIAREVAAFDIYLFPMVSGANTRSGTLPLALGTGLPVVAIDGYETDDLFVNEQNVLYASALTGPAFAEAALRLIEEPALRERLSVGARRLYLENFSWERIAERFLALT
jgi:glycosyltransferase involved in cell wall biosynthesis